MPSDKDCIRIRNSHKVMIVFMVIGLFSAGILAGIKIENTPPKAKVENCNECQERLFLEELKVKHLIKEAEELKQENRNYYEKLVTALIASEILKHFGNFNKMTKQDRKLLDDAIKDADPTNEKLFTPKEGEKK